MTKNIYVQELRMKTHSIVIWSLGVAAIVILYFSFFPSFAEEAALINKMMTQFPPELLAAFGMTNLNITSVLGFYGLVFLFVQLCVAIQAANYGVGLVSIEETELTADFLLSKPVSRSQILTGKLLAALTGMAITNIVAWVASFIALALFNGGQSYDTGTLVLLLAGLFVFQLFFVSVGLIISLLVKRIRNVTPYGLGLGFGMYVLSAFSGIQGDVKLEYITPFKHFDPNYIVQHNTYDAPLVVISVTVIVVSLAAAYWRYIHRDIASAT